MSDGAKPKITKITPEEATRRLADVTEPTCFFYCQDGTAIKNLEELEYALDNMEEETFLHHAGEGRNDFGNWVREVIGDEKLANDLVKSKSPEAASHAVTQRMTFLKNKV